MWHIRATVGVYLPHGLLFRYGNGKEMAKNRVSPRILEQSQYIRVRIHPSELTWFPSFCCLFPFSFHLFSFWFLTLAMQNNYQLSFWFAFYFWRMPVIKHWNNFWEWNLNSFIGKISTGSSVADLRSTELPHPEGKYQWIRDRRGHAKLWAQPQLSPTSTKLYRRIHATPLSHYQPFWNVSGKHGFSGVLAAQQRSLLLYDRAKPLLLGL